jgi:ATP-binding cassette subfamily B protein
MCDEATSALDSHTESHIMRSLRAVANNRTSILIAHRLSTVTDCDIIFVLRNGRIVESGSHVEVL